MIKIKARLYVPGLLMAYGNIQHLPIFEKKFDLDLTTSMLFDLLENNSIKVGEIYLRLKKVNRKKGRLDFSGGLPSISTSFFEKLKADGWIFHEEVAKQYDFPCDEKNKILQKSITDSETETRRVTQILESTGKTRLSREDQGILDDVLLRGERTGA